jgi:hypothetical protein
MLHFARMRAFAWIGILVCGCVQSADTIGLDEVPAETRVFGGASPLVRGDEMSRAREACAKIELPEERSASIGELSGVWIQCSTGTAWGLEQLQQLRRIGRLHQNTSGDVQQAERAEGTWGLRYANSRAFFESDVMFLPAEPLSVSSDGVYTRLYAGEQLQLVHIRNLIR